MVSTEAKTQRTSTEWKWGDGLGEKPIDTAPLMCLFILRVEIHTSEFLGFVFSVLGMELRVSQMLGKQSDVELHPQPLIFVLIRFMYLMYMYMCICFGFLRRAFSL